MKNWTQEFETLYLQTYQIMYHHAKLIFPEEEQARLLVILTYEEAYQREEQLQKEKEPLEWMMKRMDFLAESKLEATKEMVEESYSEERMQSKEAKKENKPELDETSLLLDIEEHLGIVDEGEALPENGVQRFAVQKMIPLILVALALAVIVFAIGQIQV